MTTETISTDLKEVLRRLKLSRMLDTLPERFGSAAEAAPGPAVLVLSDREYGLV